MPRQAADWKGHRKRKFRKGSPITDMAQLVREIEAGRYVYQRDKPQHPRVLENMTLHTLKLFLRGGQMCFARRTNQKELTA